MKRYLSKTTDEIVNALQFTGRNLEEIYTELGTIGIEAIAGDEGNYSGLVLRTRRGTISAAVGDWIIPDNKFDGMFYSCKPDIFEDRYTLINDGPEFVEEEVGQTLFSVKPSSHLLTLSISVDNPEDWHIIFTKFYDFAEAVGHLFPNLSLTSAMLNDDPKAFERVLSEEESLSAVRSTLYDEGLSKETVNDVVSRLLRAGVIFSDRVNGDAFEKVTYDEDTLGKVASALGETGMTAGDIHDAISLMQNKGILFRERG